MKDKILNNKVLIIILVMLLIGIVSTVGTYTYFAWNSTGENKDTTVTVSSVDGLGQCNKISDNNKTLLPIANKQDGRIITINAKQTLSEYASITWTLTINSINREGTSTSGLKHQTFKYELVNSSTGVSYGSGNFSNVINGSTITLSNATEKLAYNRDYTFVLYKRCAASVCDTARRFFALLKPRKSGALFYTDLDSTMSSGMFTFLIFAPTWRSLRTMLS